MTRPHSILLSFFIIIMIIPVSAHAATTKPVLPKVKAEPTLHTKQADIFALFKFGGWVRVAYNNTKAVSPLIIYAYSSIPVTITYNNHTYTGKWGPIANITFKPGDKVNITVKIGSAKYYLTFTGVSQVKEQKKPTSIVSMTKERFREWLDEEAQYSTVLALLAIVAAVTVKRKLLLIRVTNGVNILLSLFLGGGIWYVAPRFGHSKYLSLVFLTTYFAAYAVIPVGRRVYLLKVIPSMRKIIMESGVLYRTAQGKLAYARQNMSEAFKRLFGNHLLVKDAETGVPGELPEHKLWQIEDVEFLEHSNAIVTLDYKVGGEQ